MSESRRRTIVSITRQTALLVAAVALAGSAACSANPTPDAFNQPITPKSGSGSSADKAGSGDSPEGDPSGESSGADAGDTSKNSQPKTAASTKTDPNVCIAAAASAGTGEHHPGESCAGCHATMPNAAWTVSGTVFAGAGVGVPGATIEVVDAAGQTLELVTGDNGNFYTTTAVKLPLTVRSSKCPSNSAMTAKASAGNCNSCHDSTNPIIL